MHSVCMNKHTHVRTHTNAHSSIKKLGLMLRRPFLTIKLRYRVWSEWGIFHVTQKCGSARLCSLSPLPIIPTLTRKAGRHGPDTSSHSTSTITTSSQMDWMKIYCHYRSICSASAFWPFGGGWHGFKRSESLWWALPNGLRKRLRSLRLQQRPCRYYCFVILLCCGYIFWYSWYCFMNTAGEYQIR